MIVLTLYPFSSLFDILAAHFVNWPPQPAKSHSVLVDSDGNGIEGVNGTRIGGITTGGISHGGNDLASILVRLSEPDQTSQLVRLAIAHLIAQRRPELLHTLSHGTGKRTTSFTPIPTTSSTLRVLHGRVKRSEPDDQDRLIWEMLRDWIGQEQRMMAADQPALHHNEEMYESSGDDDKDPTALKGTTAIKGTVDPPVATVEGLTDWTVKEEESIVVVEPQDEEDNPDDGPGPAKMAAAESLILLHPPAPTEQSASHPKDSRSSVAEPADSHGQLNSFIFHPYGVSFYKSKMSSLAGFCRGGCRPKWL